MTRWTERLLHLRSGDLAPGVLLFAYYFLIISGYIVGQVARDALFLDHFAPDQLPYVDITIAVLVAFVVAGYIRLSHRTGLRELLAWSLTAFALTALFFWWAIGGSDSAWLFPALYVWVGIFGVMAITQVWTLANFMLTTREAKRLFGLVGAGGILGGIFGGFFSNAVVRAFGTESLLLVLAVFLMLCVALVLLIFRQHRWGPDREDQGSVGVDESPRNLLESFRLMLSSKHLTSIATLICITSIVTTAAGWQFKAIASETIVEKDALAAFFGSFQGYAGIAALAAQLMLTSRLLQRFGVGATLFILPVTLALGSLGVLATGGIFAATFLKGSDKVLRYSIDTASLQLLYLPVPANIKIQIKSFIDTVIWRLGDGLAGLTLLVFVTYLGFTPGQVSWVNLAFLGLWFVAAAAARRQYLTTLGQRVREHRIDAERMSAPVLDRSTATLLASKLEEAETEEILYRLNLFELGYQQASHPSIRGLIRHESPDVRAKALAILNAAGDSTLVDDVEDMLSDRHLRVRTEALRYLTHHSHVDPLARIGELGDFPDFTVRAGVAAFLARPGQAQNLSAARTMLDMMIDEEGAPGRTTRVEAARLISTMPEEFGSQLAHLLADPDPEIAGLAIEAAGELRERKLVPQLLERLGEPDCRDAAVNALSNFENRILGTLNDYLRDDEMSISNRSELPGVLVAIGTPEALEILTDNLFQGDSFLRFRVISALNKFQQAHPEIKVDNEMIETVLAAEILGHYRSYQALGALRDPLEQDDPAMKAFRESMDKETERIFRLLGVLFPDYDFHAAYIGVHAADSSVRDDTLEFLDTALRPELRGLLLPLVDRGVSVEDRILRANEALGARLDSSEEAIAALIHSGDPWLRSCAAYAIGTLGLRSMEAELDAWEDDPDPLLRETVRQAKAKLAAIKKV